MRSAWLLSAVLALPGAAAGFESVEFVPTESGLSATYRRGGSPPDRVEVVQPGTTLLNGEFTTRVVVVSGPGVGSEEFYSNNTNGWKFHWEVGREGNYYELFYNTPLLVFPASFEIGQAFSQANASVTYFELGFGSFPLRYDLTSQVIGIETVTVPAGTFAAIRVDRTLTYTFLTLPIVSTRVFSDWFVRHLPAVRGEGVRDGVPFLLEMVSHNISLCGDGTQNGVVDAADVALYRNALAGATLSPIELARCTAVAPQGPCDIRDVAVLRREVEGPLLSPGISKACL